MSLGQPSTASRQLTAHHPRKKQQKKKTRSCLVKKFGGFLNYLKAASPSQRKELIHRASSGEISAVCEICQNLLRGNAKASRQKLGQLRPYKAKIRTLAHKSVPIRQKRKLLQSGGFAFLPALLSLAAPLIGGLISR